MLPPPVPEAAREAATAGRESTLPPPVPDAAKAAATASDAPTPIQNGSSAASGEDKQSLVDTIHKDTKLRNSADTGEKQTAEQMKKARSKELRELDSPADKDYAPKQTRDRKTTMQRMQSFLPGGLSDEKAARTEPKWFLQRS